MRRSLFDKVDNGGPLEYWTPSNMEKMLAFPQDTPRDHRADRLISPRR